MFNFAQQKGKGREGGGANLVRWVLVAGKGPDEDLGSLAAGGGGRPSYRARAREVYWRRETANRWETHESNSFRGCSLLLCRALLWADSSFSFSFFCRCTRTGMATLVHQRKRPMKPEREHYSFSVFFSSTLGSSFS